MVMACVGAPLRIEGSNTGFHRQSSLLEHGPKHRIILQPEVILLEFKGNVAVAEVISRLKQFQRMDSADVEQRLVCGDHMNTNRLDLIRKHIARPESTITRKLQQDISATGCASPHATNRTLICREWQLEIRNRLSLDALRENDQVGIQRVGHIRSGFWASF